MAAFLLDTNALIALIWPNHRHHKSIQSWFGSLGQDHWITCPMTECGFVRISSNPHFDLETLTPSEAIAWLKQAMAHPQHAFWDEAVEICSSPRFPAKKIRGHNQITDGYLLALCLEKGGRLVTFDQGIPSLARDDADRNAILLLN